MNFTRIAVLAFTLIAASSHADNPNPTAHTAMSLTAGGWFCLLLLAHKQANLAS